ncbi:ROK family protein [Sedimenticola hydrogenitrophicus]|uniref:ROK family protein n=1 Tax=Sedimenticola hydrogenitrophicus TaxID=2967975 RepID=UPI0021A305C6|nr:ROK family protein [Sedimenticola hydrogenitrophicus]
MRIGVDLGGTKIEALALDERGQRLTRRRIPTPAGDYRATLLAVAGLIQRIEQETGRRGTVGIGTPGSLSPASELIRNANSTCLNGNPLQQDLERLLERPVRLANDADCFALSESIDGAGQGYASVFGVIIGTGVGGGIVINGSLISGANRIAGEWGHNPLPWPGTAEQPGAACYCGKRGCIETFLSGAGLAADYHRETGVSISAAALSERLAQQEQAAQRVMARYEDRLARSLAAVINLLDPEAIILGGGLSNVARLYQQVPRVWTDYIFSDVVRTRLLPPRHGDASGVRGAAWLWAVGEQD